MGASTLWRKSVDETLEFTQSALSWLRADFQGVLNVTRILQHKFSSLRIGNPPTQEDPVIYIPLNMDRLRSGITVLCDLLSFVHTSFSIEGT